MGEVRGSGSGYGSIKPGALAQNPSFSMGEGGCLGDIGSGREDPVFQALFQCKKNKSRTSVFRSPMLIFYFLPSCRESFSTTSSSNRRKSPHV